MKSRQLRSPQLTRRSPVRYENRLDATSKTLIPSGFGSDSNVTFVLAHEPDSLCERARGGEHRSAGFIARSVYLQALRISGSSREASRIQNFGN